MIISDRIDCISEMPAALMAVNSELSPRLPKVISEERRMASGNACGISISPMYQKNCASTSIDSPFPISSSTYRHRNCIISTNWQMKKVAINSRPNCLVINMSNFLMRSINQSPLTRCSRSKLSSQMPRKSDSSSSSAAKSVMSRLSCPVRSLLTMRISQKASGVSSW